MRTYRSARERKTNPGRFEIRFVPVQNGTIVDLGDLGHPQDKPYYATSMAHKLLGFRPTPGRKIAGHLVIAVDLGAAKTSQPRRIRERRSPSEPLRAVS